MKQLLQNIRTGDTIVAEVPAPTPKEGTALVQTAASLVSAGTERMLVEFAEKSLAGKARSRPDLVRQVIDKAQREGVITTIEAAFNRLDQPIPLGYSSAGTIIETGKGLKGFQVGQRVACAGGGYAVHAEFNLVPQNLLAPVPDNVDLESAAFATLGAIALHGFRLAEIQISESVAVIGLGLLGILTAIIAKAAGCQVLGIDLDPSRIKFARQFGIEASLRDHAEERSLSFSRGFGLDAILICADTTSNDPVELAGLIARDRARVVAIGAVGLNIPRKLYYEKEISFINSRSYGPGRYDPRYEEAGQDYPIGYVRWTEGRNLESFLNLIGTGLIDVKPLITHRFPIDDALDAYELITRKRDEPFLGILITYPGTEYDVNSTVDKKIIINKAVPRSQNAVISLGVIGAGNFASAVMLPSIKKIPAINLIGISSATGVNAQHAANRYHIKYATSDTDQIISDPAVNTVAILTRHHLHSQQVIKALQANKNVFCEKPLALTMEELEEINIELEKVSPDKMLMVGFNRRFAPFAIRLKEVFDFRTEPMVVHYRINAGHLPPSHWLHDLQIGGGRIIGEACHFIDFLLYLVDTPPTSVYSQSLPDNGRYHQDNVLMSFQFPDGSLGIVSYLSNGDRSFSKERLEVFSEGRIAVLDDFRLLQTVQNGHQETKRSRFRQDKGHQAEWEAFVQAINQGGPPPIPYSHIFGSMKATFAAVESLHKGSKITINS